MLKTPRLSVVRNDDLSYNFSDLLEEFTAKPEPQSEPPPATEPLHFSFNNIRLQNGRIDFDDRPKRAQHTVADLNLGLPFLSNLPYDVDVYTEPSFAVNVNGTPIELTGRSKPFSDSRETSLDVNINNVELPKYLEYVPADLRFNLNSGNLSTKLALSFTQPKEPTPVLVVKGKIELNRLAVTDLDGHPVVSLSLLDVPVELLDVFGRKANLGTILLQGPKVHLRLNKAGVLNVTTLVEDRQAETGEKTGTEIKQTQAEKEKVEAGNEAEKAVGSAKETEALEKAEVETVTETRNIETEQKTAESVPVVVEIPEIRLTDGKVTFIDDTQEQSFQTTLDDLNIVARQVSTDATKPMTLEVSCKSDAGEVIQQTGTVVRLKWKSLHVTGVNVNTRPFLVSINEVTLADFYSRLTINPDTTLNVQGIVVEQPLAAPTVQDCQSDSPGWDCGFQ